MSLQKAEASYQDVGFALDVIGSTRLPLDRAKFGLPGYSSIGRLFAIGYIRGLREAISAGWGFRLET